MYFSELLIEHLQEALLLCAVISGIPTLAIMCTGLFVSTLQSVTQIQEQTLSSVPKLLIFALVTYICGEWLASLIVDFSTELFNSFPQLSGVIVR